MSPGRQRPRQNQAAAAVLLLLGLALLAFAACADTAWFARHVQTLDSYDAPARWLPAAWRTVAAVLGLLACISAWLMQKRMEGLSAGALFRGTAAVLLSLAVSEGVLRYADRHKSEERRMLHVRLGQPHPRYGWILRPSQSFTVRLAGRDLALSLDAEGNRVRSPAEVPDKARPSLIVAGESVAIGHDLRWDETFAARAAAALGLSPVNLAVNGYGVDQAWLRLTDALPAYAQPRAVVMVVMPVQLGRNLIDNHPRLTLREDGGFDLLPAAGGPFAALKLRSLFVQQLPLRSDAEIARTIGLTRALLADLAARARTRGARPLFVVPSPGPLRALDDHPEAWLLHALFDGAALPWLLVDLPDGERFPNDGHPNPRGAAHLADAIVQALR